MTYFVLLILVATIFLTFRMYRTSVQTGNLIDFDRTSRGFQIGEFYDLRGTKCSIQDSSLATKAALWFGVSDPIITAPEGFEFHPDTLFSDRMHLDQSLVKDLSVWLRRFVAERDDFESERFSDLYGDFYSIKKVGDTLIFGIEGSVPKLMISGQGWTNVIYPEGTIIDCKMHLNVEQVLEILNVLDHFVESGTVNMSIEDAWSSDEEEYEDDDWGDDEEDDEYEDDDDDWGDDEEDDEYEDDDPEEREL